MLLLDSQSAIRASDVRPAAWPISPIDVLRNADALGVQGPRGFWPLWGPGAIRDAVSMTEGVPPTDTWTVTGAKFAQVAPYQSTTGLVNWIGTADFSFFVVATGTSGSGDGILGAGSTAYGQWILRTSGTPNQVQWLAPNSVGDLGILSTSSFADGEVFSCCGTRRGATATLYVNGVAEGTDTSANSDIYTTEPFVLGGGSGFSSLAYLGELRTVQMYDDALSAGQAATLHEQPYALLAHPRVPIWFDMAAAAPSTAARIYTPFTEHGSFGGSSPLRVA